MHTSNDTHANGSPPIMLAARFLFPLSDTAASNPLAWRSAGKWFLLWGVVTGILYAVVFRITWRWFGEYQYIRFVPVAFVLVVDLAWGGYHLLSGAVSLVAPRIRDDETAPPPQLPVVLAVVLVVVLKYAMLLSLPMGVTRPMQAIHWLEWRDRLWLLYPQVIYRPLILMPLWGRWAMLLAMSLGRPSPGSTARFRHMAGASRLWLIMACWVACTALTVFYGSALAGHLGRGLVLALGVLVAVYLAGFVLCRRMGGQTEATVRAAGLVGELAFLALYLPIASDIYWY